jgi:hypothetical protein
MELTKLLNTNKIKRRNFFFTLGTSVLGLVSLSKLPLKYFTSKMSGHFGDDRKVRITPNPLAVSRDKEGKGNG